MASIVNAQQSSILNRIWRIAATGFCFAVFGLGGLLLSTFWFSTIRLLVKDRQRCTQLTQNSIRYSFKLFIWLMRFVRVLDYQFYNIDKLKQDAGCIIVANHPSLLDYVFLASCMPRCDCIVKQSLLHNVFVRGVIKSAGYIANSESEILLPQCKEILNNKGMILIFPEGTRTTPGQEMHLQRGAANIAVRCDADIRLVTIHCDQPMLTKQGKWYNIPKMKPLFQIVVKEKISAKDYAAEGDASPAIAARRLTRILSQKLIPEPIKTNEKK
ncbi:1-acyl-sn-glycerol-3-phosphate acyltransferase [Limnobaculum zhutongyuii]|uniref:1-acyl-sn-glycerol-3-phosphate acyltransferase n=1 Tax=Limnobaculum zhutongyuii TaxID=2498113 RepID=A0A411WQU9_9GAMM|nr:lysophospholipid acyltransferase family protein [Limnobaculum zhutongyuii]QBH98578.1 1-acyl-sn-glycerol-3-phosphate acyltransferase [Limnobaculum zhutongyuii]TQS86859.1 1-acyl-sn-glycerol-3-phosphate acyltransferase [Limnobaculum zhutongyuii]